MLVVAILNSDGQLFADAVDRFTRHVVRPSRNPSENSEQFFNSLPLLFGNTSANNPSLYFRGMTTPITTPVMARSTNDSPVCSL